MKPTTMFWIGLSAIALAAQSPACPFCKRKTTGLFLGETVMMGNGTVHSWVNLDKKGNPERVGISFPETALQGLPTEIKGPMGPEFNVRFPEQAERTPFTHVGIDWNPKGHEPIVYGTPHFDFHFYTIEESERSAITLKGNDLAKCKRPMPKKLAPEGYVYAPGAEVPYMGAHLVSMASPEFHGQAFDKTLIYGSYDARLAFIEPMITMDYLASKPAFHGPLPKMAAVAKSGFYPTEYGIVYNESRREYTIELTKFVWRSRTLNCER